MGSRKIKITATRHAAMYSHLVLTYNDPNFPKIFKKREKHTNI